MFRFFDEVVIINSLRKLIEAIYKREIYLNDENNCACKAGSRY